MAARRARISSLSGGGGAEDVVATGLMGEGTAAGGSMYASPVTGGTGGSSSSTSKTLPSMIASRGGATAAAGASLSLALPPEGSSQ